MKLQGQPVTGHIQVMFEPIENLHVLCGKGQFHHHYHFSQVNVNFLIFCNGYFNLILVPELSESNIPVLFTYMDCQGLFASSCLLSRPQSSRVSVTYHWFEKV